MASVDKIKELKSKYQDLAVVCYINSSAELKCMSDVCVTSSNAVKIVKSLPNKNIYFIPDRNLGAFIADSVPEKNVILNDGCCPIHARISPEQVLKLKKLYPDAPVLSHPECEKEVLKFIEASTPHGYWLARGFILLADTYMKQGKSMEAKQYLLSLQNNYDGDDDIAGMIAERLEKLSTENKQK
jgi:quinolinate synthetase A subunit